MKPIAVYCIADQKNLPYANTMIKSLRKFHDWDVILITDEKDTKKHPQVKNLIIEDLTPFLADPAFFYRATPVLAEKYLEDYECVLKIDADSLILGDLSYVLETNDYDVATVINWNRFDVQYFPPVELARIGVFPAEYFNCGFVALRSKKFAHNWTVNCFSPQFDRLQYREQDILNIMCYYGNWNVRCLDLPDEPKKHYAWHGLLGKFEWQRAIIKDGKIIVPQGLGDQPFPPTDIEIKVAHLAGGNGSPKDNWSAFFSPEAMERINEIIK